MRIAKRLLRRVRDFAEVSGEDTVSLARARSALNELDIDELGLEARDRVILETLITKFAGGPTGVNTLATAVGEDGNTLRRSLRTVPDSKRPPQPNPARPRRHRTRLHALRLQLHAARPVGTVYPR